MKVIIIDGPDNVGKTTLINRLIENSSDAYYIHCQKPKSKDPVKAALEQKAYFKKLVEDIVKLKEAVEPELVIFDRSWIGEYVYGCKYRNNGEEYVLEMIDDIYKRLRIIESEYNAKDHSFEYYTILLTVDNPEFCVRHDDGKSISQADIENITDEINRFDNIYRWARNKTMDWRKIIVNDGLNFKSENTIFEEVVHILKSIKFHAKN